MCCQQHHIMSCTVLLLAILYTVYSMCAVRTYIIVFSAGQKIMLVPLAQKAASLCLPICMVVTAVLQWVSYR